MVQRNFYSLVSFCLSKPLKNRHLLGEGNVVSIVLTRRAKACAKPIGFSPPCKQQAQELCTEGMESFMCIQIYFLDTKVAAACWMRSMALTVMLYSMQPLSMQCCLAKAVTAGIARCKHVRALKMSLGWL